MSPVRIFIAGAAFTTALFSGAHASAQTLYYHGQLTNPQGSAVASTNTYFKVKITPPGNESCTLYEESHTIRTSTDGSFTIPIGQGTVNASTSHSTSLADAFRNNSTTLTFTGSQCAAGASQTTFTPTAHSGRSFVLSFSFDNATWDSFSAETIAQTAFAVEAQKIAGLGASNLLRVDDTAAASNTTPFTSAQFTSLVDLVDGTSTKYVVSSGSSGAAMPSFATNPSTLTTGSMWYDTTSNQLKYYNGTTVQTLGAGGGGGSGTVTALTIGTGLVDGSGGTGTIITTAGTIALPAVGTAGTYYKVTTDTQGRVSSGSGSLAETDIPTLTTAGKVSGSALTSGTIGGSTAISTSGNLQTSGDITSKRVFLQDSGANYAGIKAPTAVTSTYLLTLPTALPGSNGQILSSDTSGNLSWTTPSSGAVSSVGATTPLSNTGTASDPVIAIQQASGSQAGYLSSTDWTTFNSKLDAALASGKIRVGNAGGTATAVAPSGDVTMTNAGVFTVAKIQGIAVSATAPSTAGQVLRYDGASSYAAAQLSTSDISGLTTALSGKIDSSQMPANCAANQTLTFSSPTGTWTCSNIAITGAAFGSQAQNLVLASPDGSSGNPSFRALTATDIPSLSAAKITSGTLAATQGGTGQTGYSTGDLLYASAANTLSRLSVGSNGQVLTLASGVPSWSSPSGDNLGNHTATANIQLGSYWLSGDGGNEGISVDASGNVGIGTTSPAASLDISSKTDALALPKGATAQRPGSPSSGWIRYNSTNTAVEYYNGSGWTSLAAGSYLPTSGGTLTGALTISSGGASISGGLNNNSGGITNAGSIAGVGANLTGSGAMSVAAGGTNQALTLSGSGTGAIVMNSNVGIGTTAPGQKLSVAGVIESTTGGVKFPDGSTQTTAMRTPAANAVATSETCNSATYSDIATVGPSVSATISATGSALITITTQSSSTNAAATCHAALEISGSASLVASDEYSRSASGTAVTQSSSTFLVTGLTAGVSTFAIKYKVSGGAYICTFQYRSIIVIPL